MNLCAADNSHSWQNITSFGKSALKSFKRCQPVKLTRITALPASPEGQCHPYKHRRSSQVTSAIPQDMCPSTPELGGILAKRPSCKREMHRHSPSNLDTITHAVATTTCTKRRPAAQAVLSYKATCQKFYISCNPEPRSCRFYAEFANDWVRHQQRLFIPRPSAVQARRQTENPAVVQPSISRLSVPPSLSLNRHTSIVSY